MLVDHINTLFLHPPAPELYALGRTAFPLFVLVWAINAGQRPERLQRRANRLWGWALLTQPVFVFASSGGQIYCATTNSAKPGMWMSARNCMAR
nr:TraX family protein [uncultured Enterobacter sp.]